MADSAGNGARDSATDVGEALPVAALRPARRFSLIWLVPVMAAVFACWLAWQAWSGRGIEIVVHLPDGFGLKPGDDVRFRGIAVGAVDRVEIAEDLREVIVTARLTAQAQRLARTGTRFWVVRPRLGLTSVEGLETIIGPRFLAVLPGDDAPARSQRQFIGLAGPPLLDDAQPGGLQIVLQAGARGSLAPGAPILYRQTRIGTVLSVNLAGDGGSVEAGAHIERPYVALIRPKSRFWDVGGLKAEMGLTGLRLDIQSAETLLAGGVAVATPPDAGEIVRTGHRFQMDAEPEKEWATWNPMVAIGNSLLPEGASPPSPLRASLVWEQGRIISREKSVRGWLLQTDEGLLGPLDLLKPGEKADRESVMLEVAGQVVPLAGAALREANGIGVLAKALASQPVWPRTRMRRPAGPEECVAIADSALNALPIAAARLSLIAVNGSQDSGWAIDRAITLDEAWHGACVVSRADGALVGIVLVRDRDEPVIALVQ